MDNFYLCGVGIYLGVGLFGVVCFVKIVVDFVLDFVIFVLMGNSVEVGV